MFLEGLFIALLLAACAAMVWQAGAVMRYTQATANALHAPAIYIRAIMSAAPVPSAAAAGNQGNAGGRGGTTSQGGTGGAAPTGITVDADTTAAPPRTAGSPP